ncbi:MAG: protealysin inhibitor emfourin, partial [Dermatophilaceae bacterium]
MPRRPNQAVISFVPPYLLEALASSENTALAATARSTLDIDAGFRSGRTVPGTRPPATGATPTTPGAAGLQRTVHDGGGGTDLPGTKVRGEGDPATDD